MTKKTLKQKINCVKWVTLLFAIIYFAVGAILKSNGPVFDPDKTYELIKDSLTLTAYFLAPIAAFVLFSDWREQHVEKLLEQESSEIYALYIAIIDTWQQYRFDVEEDELFTQSTIESREIKHFGLIDQVEKAIQKTEQLQSRDIKTKEFTELALKSFKDIRNIIFELNILGGFKEKQFNPQKYNFEYTDELDSEFSSRMELNYQGMQDQMMKGFMDVYGNKEKLFSLSTGLKIRN
ncbi:hypothetical protein G4V72_04335 [Acinetobacter sp. GC2]|uniref:hypothetical protein n=1 Tax=Acinetobacter lwoffii TaxID=28090 RepID=UPI0013DEB94F|nr:hypothetical protein [Acinetobacter lwoffii]NGP40967.1 hypothetical protein [Acinetobacter lwoffii]